MLKTFVLLPLRSLLKYGRYSLLNMFGLAVSIGAAFVIFCIIRNETSYDDFHENKDRIVRVNSMMQTEEGTTFSSAVPFPLASTLRLEFPDIKTVAGIYKQNDALIKINDGGRIKQFAHNDIYFAEEQFFSIFDFEWKYGTQKALAEPNNIVLSEEKAIAFFGDANAAINKTVDLGGTAYKVAGILREQTQLTDFPLSIVVSYSSLKNTNAARVVNDWATVYRNANVYMLLTTKDQAISLDGRLKGIAAKYFPPKLAKNTFVMQKLSTIHSDDRFQNYSNRVFSPELVRSLTAIAIFLLVMGCINFINLSTALSVKRSKEIAVRKILGESPAGLQTRVFAESTILSAAAITAGIVLGYAAFPLVEPLIAHKLQVSFTAMSFWIFVTVMLVFVSFFSAIYPAILALKAKPVEALNAKVRAMSSAGMNFRRGLLIFQYILAHLLIIATFLVAAQLNFFSSRPLGFTKESIISVRLPQDSAAQKKFTVLTNTLTQNKNVLSYSYSYTVPAAPANWESDFNFDGSSKTTPFNADLKWADEKYFQTYDIRLAAGRIYRPADSVGEFVVNEQLVKQLGLKDPQAALGRTISFWDNTLKGQIVGVVKDFHTRPLSQPVVPVVMSNWKDLYQILNIRIATGKTKDVTDALQTTWNELFPESYFEVSYFDRELDNFYISQNNLYRLFKLFAFLALVICCLGLYSMVSLMSVQRSKEVAVRRVLGAGGSDILLLFSKEFLLLITAGFVIAAPFAYYGMQQWLNNFAYRVPLNIGTFLIAFLPTLLITMSTIGYTCRTALKRRPTASLSAER